MEVKTKLELGWGNPDFLQPYWSANPIHLNIELDQNLAYQFTGLEELKLSIKFLHNKIGNAKTDNRYVVIGNGATNLLNGLLSINSSPLVYAEPPCYHKFYEYAKAQNKTWACHKNSIEIVTVPNNPTGEKFPGTADYKIHDLSYNWPTYGFIEQGDYDVMIFGLSKATGHASARIGWVLLKDKETAEKLENWLHINSCGVSYYSQIVANKIIKHQLYATDTIFKYGESVLNDRWRNVLLDLDLPFDRLNGKGMFMWCEGQCPEDINSVPGELLGGDKNNFRLSLGVSEEVWQEFLNRYGK